MPTKHSLLSPILNLNILVKAVFYVSSPQFQLVIVTQENNLKIDNFGKEEGDIKSKLIVSILISQFQFTIFNAILISLQPHLQKKKKY